MVQPTARPRSNPPRYELRYEKNDLPRRITKPYAVTELAAAPSSRGVRPNRRLSREKGKGWQKSKAGSHDFGSTSEIFFSERTAAVQHCRPRARSTGREMSRERARNCSQSGSYYDKECCHQRRSSVEARTRAVKSQASNGIRHSNCSQMPGPPVQKRVFTCLPLQSDHCITEDAEIVGYTQVANDKALVKPKTEVREGPKAGQYIAKKRTHAVGKDFPEVEDKPFVCEREKMDMLVSTSDFRERGDQSAPTTDEYLTDDTSPWPIHGDYFPEPDSPLAKNVNQVRIEFKDNKVYQGDKLPGRIFIDLKKPTRLDEAVVDLNQTMVGLTSDGTLKPLSDYGSSNEVILPKKLNDKNRSTTTTRTPSDKFHALPLKDTKKVTLPAGTNAIPFEIEVPKGAIPTFNYVSPKNGASVVNNYSAEGVARLNGKTARTDRVTAEVKGYGDSQGGVGLNDNTNEVAVAKKYVKMGGGIDYALGQEKDSERPKYDDIDANVVQKVRCPPVGIDDERILRPNLKPSRSSKSSSSVINQYNDDPTNSSKLPNNNLSQVFEQENAAINSDLPSIKTRDFESDYKLRLKGEDATYEAPFAVVDELKQGWRPTHLTPPTSIRRI